MRLKYRPMAVIGFSMLLILFLCINVNENIAVVSAMSGAVLMIVSLAFKKFREKIVPLFLAASMIFSGLAFLACDSQTTDVVKFIGKKAVVEGVLIDYPEYNNSRYYYIIKTSKIDSEEADTKIRLSLPNEIDIEPYDTIKLTATIYEIGLSSDDIRLYFKSKGIILGAYAYNDENFDVAITKRSEESLNYRLLILRHEIEQRILDKLPNEYGGIIIGMLLGDKSNISETTVSDFREAGIAPLFAVSGLHLSIWVLGLYEILRQLKVNKRLNSLIGILFSLFFMALTGFSPSVCRAGLMMVLMLCGSLFYRKVDSVNSLGFSVLVLCVINPFIAADVGFLLSFFATLGIVTIYSSANKLLLSRMPDTLFFSILKAVLSAILVSISATIGAMPVTIIFIGYISLYSILTNLLVTYAATICMVVGGFISVLYKVSFISDALAIISGLLSKYILFIIKTVASFSVKTISTSDIYWKSGVILCLASLAFALIVFRGKAFVKVTCVLVSASILVCSAFSYVHYNGLTEIRILNVENGIAIVAFNGKNKAVLGCAADYYYTSGIVEMNLEEISRHDANFLLIPNSEAAVNQTTLSLLKNNNFEKIILPTENRCVNMLTDEESIAITDNAMINLWEGGTAECFCCKDYCVAFCTFDSVTFTILFSSKRNANIPEKYLESDYLICCGYIPESVDVSLFKKVIVSLTSEYGKPICDYVNGKGTDTLLTAHNGDITFDIKNGFVKIMAEEV